MAIDYLIATKAPVLLCTGAFDVGRRLQSMLRLGYPILLLILYIPASDRL